MDEQERLMFLGWAKLPQFKKKVTQSLVYIQEALSITDNAFVSISWGKDSIVLLHLVQQIKQDILAINFSDQYRNLQSNYQEVIDNYPFLPNYQELYIGGKFKNAVDMELTFIGCRSQESKYRKIAIKKYGVNYQYKSGKYRSFPLAFWDVKDIWGYLISNNLPYLKDYESDFNKRTSVIHNFNLHQNQGHRAKLIRYGIISELKKDNPEYFALYQQFYPEINNYV
jgi:predicted phosphoadenosine phosphosulfate sulfurtransferase